MGICQSCGRVAETKYVAYYQNIGLLFLHLLRSAKGNFCKDCTNRYFWRYTGTTLLLGWWGIISFFITLFVLPNNIIRYLGTLGLRRP